MVKVMLVLATIENTISVEGKWHVLSSSAYAHAHEAKYHDMI